GVCFERRRGGLPLLLELRCSDIDLMIVLLLGEPFCGLESLTILPFLLELRGGGLRLALRGGPLQVLRDLLRKHLWVAAVPRGRALGAPARRGGHPAVACA